MSILMQTERYNKPKQKVAISSVTLNERQDLHNIRVPLPTPTPASREASSSVSGYFLAGRRRTELTVVHLAGRLAADAGASIWPGGAGWDLVGDPSERGGVEPQNASIGEHVAASESVDIVDRSRDGRS